MKLEINNKTLSISNPEKILFPEDKITKIDLINYYLRIAPFILPFTKNHPISMQRYPNGIYGKSFFQKDAPAYFPDWILRENVLKNEDGYTHYVVCQNTETLIYLANLACISIHLWLSTIEHLNMPDRLIFDLDPPSADYFDLVRETALSFRTILEELGLNPFVMTTGSRGLHIIVPIESLLPYSTVQNFARACAILLLRKNPKELTLELNKGKRDDRLFIDIYRNQFSATAVSPFSVRPKPKAPVATPLHWHELENNKLNSQTYNINNIFKRIETIDDPWKEIHKAQSLLESTKKLINLLEYH